MNDPLIALLVFLFALVALAFVGTQDAHDAEQAEAHYREMVCAGAWPDYKRLNPECGP